MDGLLCDLAARTLNSKQDIWVLSWLTFKEHHEPVKVTPTYSDLAFFICETG